MASRYELASGALVICGLATGCAEPTLEVTADHPAQPAASTRPLPAEPEAYGDGYDPARHLAPASSGHHHHHHSMPSAPAEADEGAGGGGGGAP